MSDPAREVRMDYKLLEALRRGDETVVRTFLSQDTEPSEVTDHAVDVERRSWRAVTTGGNSALHIVAGFGHLNLAKLICARDSSLLEARNAVLETPLHCAARAGADRIVKLFISVATDSSRLEELLLAKDREGKTALYVAAEEGRAAAAKELMSALPKLATEDDEKGVSPLYVAVLSESLQVVQILIESPADASYAGPNGQTALHAATRIKNPEIAEKLLRWKATLAKIADNLESTPLHYLAKTVNRYMVRQLLKYDTSPAYHSDSNGFRPVHVASRLGRSDIVCEIVNCCPDMDELVDNKGRNFLHIAVVYNRATIVRFVCQSPLLVKMMNAKDYDGNTPLHLAVAFQNQGIKSILLENKSVQPRITNKAGQTPQDVAKTRLYKSVHARIMNKDGQTLLDYEIVHPSIINKDGRTPLDNEIIRFEHGSRTPLNEEITRLQHGSTLRFDHESDDKIHRLEFGSILQHAHERDSPPPPQAPEKPKEKAPSQTEELLAINDQKSKYFISSSYLTREYKGDNQTLFGYKMITEEEDEDETVFWPEWKQKRDRLLGELMRGDERIVRTLFPPATEASVVADHSAIDVPGSIENVADQAGDRISWTRDSFLLEEARNAALHCAARAGAYEIVSLFISEARRLEEGRQLEAVLRATDREGKTALHAAAEQGHAAVVRILVSEDPGLTAIVDDNGVSPLYAAVLSKSLQVVQILIEFPSEGGTAGATPKISYAGPNRQTALHAAAIVQSTEIADKLLQWKPKLAKKVDNSGSTPLHYIVTTSNIKMVRQLLKHDSSTAYHSDSAGFYPIHIAASMGSCGIIHELIDGHYGMSELVDNQGRNFLHIAVLYDRSMVVEYVCQDRPMVVKYVCQHKPIAVKYVCQHRELVRMMNARDNKGNTPLHLAVSSHNQGIVRLLLENKSVHPSIMNNDGETPLDLAIIKINYDLISIQNPEIWIFHCLQQIDAIHGPRRLDRLIYDPEHKDNPKQNRENEPNKCESAKQNHENEPNKYESGKQNRENEPNKYESTAQNLVIVSVLIATVTFAAAFTMPGGIIADDHQNGGTPTLARKYAFTAFIISDCIAFCCSIMATIWLIYAGSLAINHSGQLNLILRSQDLMDVAAQCMMAAFALSLYVALSPVYFSFALALCLSIFPSVLLSSPEFWQRIQLIRTLKRRLGWSAMCKARVIGRPLGLATNSINWYIFPSMENFNWYIFRPIASYLLVYMLIFGASLIFTIKHLHFI